MPRRLNRLTVQIDRYITAIGESDQPVQPMMERLNKLEAERATLAEKVRLIASEGNVVTLHRWPSISSRQALMRCTMDCWAKLATPSPSRVGGPPSARCSSNSLCMRRPSDTPTK